MQEEQPSPPVLAKSDSLPHKIILVAGVQENASFLSFVIDMEKEWKGRQGRLIFVLCGNLLNFFPNNLQDVADKEGSLCYQLFPDKVEKLFSAGISETKPSRDLHLLLSSMLQQSLHPCGAKYHVTQRLAYERYKKLFQSWYEVLDDRTHIFFVDGRFDFPSLSECAALPFSPKIQKLGHDCPVFELDGVFIGGLGGGIQRETPSESATATAASALLLKKAPKVEQVDLVCDVHQDEIGERLTRLQGLVQTLFR